MSTHNICFHGEIQKKKKSGYPSYLELCKMILFNARFDDCRLLR